MRFLLNQRGQAAVEFVALLPVVVGLAVVVWQVVVIGYANWVAHSAARAAARAHALGENPRLAAQRIVPVGLKPGVRIGEARDNRVEVKLRLPVVGQLGRFGEVKANAHFERQS
jgi:hypothetical protein